MSDSAEDEELSEMMPRMPGSVPTGGQSRGTWRRNRSERNLWV